MHKKDLPVDIVTPEERRRRRASDNQKPAKSDPSVWSPPTKPLPSPRPAPAMNAARPGGAAPRNGSAKENKRPGPLNKKEVQSKIDHGKKKSKDPKEKGIEDIFSGNDLMLAEMLQKDVVSNSPGISWDDIAGLEDAKRVLEEAVVWPLWKPNMFKGIRRPPKGVLLFGPPGTGKTLLAKAIATECQTTFFSISSSTLGSKYRGESERMVKVLFEMARAFAPSTIFIDEIDSLCGSRGGDGEHEASRRVKTEFLVQIDGCNSGGEDGQPAPYVMVLAATNYPWELDEALRRRMEKRIFINLPTEVQIKSLLEINLKGLRIDADCDLEKLAKRMKGFSGDDVGNVCRDAAMNGMRSVMAGKSKEEIIAMETMQVAAPVKIADFEAALKRIHPSVSKEDVVRHQEWVNEFGSS